jgi:hypothetical protein
MGKSFLETDHRKRVTDIFWDQVIAELPVKQALIVNSAVQKIGMAFETSRLFSMKTRAIRVSSVKTFHRRSILKTLKN